MRGRFRYLDARYVDDLAAAKARNPYYREYPPGVGNEPIEMPVLCGLIDFLMYVLIIFPFALTDQILFFLWMLTIPFGFLSAVMPVGPVSAWYWRKSRANRAPAKTELTEDVVTALRTKRQWLKELAVESVRVEKELSQGLEDSGDLRFAFEVQIRQAQNTRTQISVEIMKIDSQLSELDA